jgi:cytochrome c-type biogenesis protein CcmF
MVTFGPAGLVSPPLELPGMAGVTVRVAAIDADNGRVRLLTTGAPSRALDPGTPASFTLDLTVKPLIGLVWSGIVILLLGTLLAVIRRARPMPAQATQELP